MARFKTLMIETGEATVGDDGTAIITLESPFTSTPTINVNIAPLSTSSGGPGSGSLDLPSSNANCIVTELSKASGLWSFKLETENSDGDYANIQILWRAIGPVPGT